MNTRQFESDSRDRPWRKDAAPANRPPSNPAYPKRPFNHDEWMKSSKPMEEGSDIPVPGDTIRTPKLEGKVSKVEEGYVYFTTADGRNMRNTVENCTVVEKLADQENEMCEDEELDEVSTEVLTKYKTAAAADARAADKSGDVARGNKRFSGIVKATKKQFDNDAQKHTKEGLKGGVAGAVAGATITKTPSGAMTGYKLGSAAQDFLTDEDKRQVSELTIPGLEDNFTASDISGLERISDLETLKARAKVLVKGKAARRMKPEKISWFYDKIDGMTNKMAIIKLMYDLLLAGEGNSVIGSRNSMRQNTYRDRFGEGSMGGINRSAPSNDVSYEKVLDEVYGKWNEEQVNELSVGALNSYKDAANSPDNFRTRPLRKLAKTVDGVRTATQKINTKTGKRSGISQPGRGEMEEDLKATFGDLLGKQHQEKEKVTKIDVTKLPSKNENFAIWFKPQTDKLRPVKWQVRSKDGSVTKHEGSSSNEKDAFNDAEDWIAKSGETSSASNNVTINFNAAFARDVAPDGQTLWTTFWEGPIFVYSESPQEGYTRTVIRTPEHSRTAGAALLPVTGMSPKKANEIGLRTNSRYTLGPREELQPGIYGYTLQWHSRVEKGTPVPLQEPSITTSSKEEAVSEVYQGPHLGDPAKLAKAPKSQMQGKDGVTFSELVQDTINVHGVKDAFEFYVKKHGLSPRQFQIYAGLTVDRKPTRPSDPAPASPANKPAQQSWWQKLRGKLPFEE